jgi:hypothetical protein
MTKSKSPPQAGKKRTPKTKPTAQSVALTLPQPRIPTLPQTPPPILNKQQTVNLLLARLIQRRDQEIADYKATRPLILESVTNALKDILYSNGLDRIAETLHSPEDISFYCNGKGITFHIDLPVSKAYADLFTLHRKSPPHPLTEYEITEARRNFNRNIVAAEVAKIRVHLDDPAVCSALDSLINVER